MEHRVLFTASTASHIRHFHLPYLRDFQERGWTVHVACGGCDGAIPYADEVLSLPLEKRMSAPANFRAALLLRRKIARERYDLVICHTSLAAFFTRLAVRGMRDRPAVINMVHGYLFDDETPALKRQLLLTAERLMAPCTDLVLTMNRWDDQIAHREHLGARVAYVPGVGVDFSRLQPVPPSARKALRQTYGIPQEAFVLFYAAEFSARKSQSVLIRAMAQLPKQVVLVLAGDGALLAQCQELARSCGVADRVIFPGYQSDVGLWYGTADAAVSASRSEGLPFNIMEALYAGLPVVASAVKGHTDLIVHGETGLLYPYGDSGAFARQVQTLLDDPALRERLGRSGAAAVRPYGLEAVLPQVVARYHALVPEDAEKETAAVR